MKEEEFDALFRLKIEADAPIWDEAKVWQKIENGQQKKRPVYWPYVASIALVISLGIYGLFSLSTKTEQPVVLSKINKINLDKKVIQDADIQLVENKIYVKQKEKKGLNQEVKVEKIPQFLGNEILHKEEIIVENLIKKETIFNEQKKASTQPISVVFEEEKRANLEKKEVPQNRVVVLNIPVEGEEKMIRKKRLVGRFFQQMGRFSNGHKFDWEEVNIRPNKIWAYLKSNFVADSTTYH